MIQRRKFIEDYGQIPNDSLPTALKDLKDAKKIRRDNAYLLTDNHNCIKIVKLDNTIVRGILKG